MVPDPEITRFVLKSFVTLIALAEMVLLTVTLAPLVKVTLSPVAKYVEILLVLLIHGLFAVSVFQ